MQFNTLRPIQNGRHFAEDIFKCIFLNENAWIPIKISLKFVFKGPLCSKMMTQFTETQYTSADLIEINEYLP